jgi:glycerol-1-phosphatase
MESVIPQQFRDDAVELPGSRALLTQLVDAGAPWAIVTSGTRPLLTGWLDVMKLAQPQHLVTAEDVAQGKPDPAGYKLGCEKLGVQDQNDDGKPVCLVLEDAPAGVRAGKAAGFTVCALATTHSIEQLRDAGADFIVRDLRSVRMQSWDAQAGTVGILIADAIKL